MGACMIMHAIFFSRVSMNIHEQRIPDEQGNAHGNLVMMCKHNVYMTYRYLL